MKKKDHNAHELIKLIDKPKKWRQGASIILIEIYDKLDRQSWRDAAIIGLLLMLFALLTANLLK